MKTTWSFDFTKMLNALTRPDAFPAALRLSGPAIPVVQTHASVVLLTPTRVYKLKKPMNFGFFDYSTPALRRHFCQQEVYINSKLAPQIYLGVAPVIVSVGGHVRFGTTYHPDEVPYPWTPLAGGYVIDFAVVMVRLADETTLESRVRTGMAAPQLEEVAQEIAAFHRSTPSNEHIASFGALEVVAKNWEENFAQMKPYIGRTLDAATYDLLVDYVHCFLKEHAALFAMRQRGGYIRDCHGDLRLQHIYLSEAKQDATQDPPHIVILDRIEFNERFRYGDVAAEVAFLTMELDAACRADLSRIFSSAYSHAAHDETLYELLPFYSCYRACVRGKVFSFQLDEPEIADVQREAVSREASSLFALAAHYASGPAQPMLIMVGGLMGTGKSTLAYVLHRELGWSLFSSDSVRKQLAQLDPEQPQETAFGQGIYSPEWTARTYATLQLKVREYITSGRSILLDASFIRQIHRQMMAQEAAVRGARVFFVECVCSQELALARLAMRWQERVERHGDTHQEASYASDGRPDLYAAQCAQWEPITNEEASRGRHLRVNTMLQPIKNVEQLLDALDMPHFACWL
ncbi:MAG TPA: AAA family ATPase [Ktedonobacteraceae bacterium]